MLHWLCVCHCTETFLLFTYLFLSFFLSLPLSVRLCVLCAHTTQSWQLDRLNFNAYDSFFSIYRFPHTFAPSTFILLFWHPITHILHTNKHLMNHSHHITCPCFKNVYKLYPHSHTHKQVNKRLFSTSSYLVIADEVRGGIHIEKRKREWEGERSSEREQIQTLASNTATPVTKLYTWQIFARVLYAPELRQQ